MSENCLQKLKGHTAIISGGLGDIGKAIAIALAKQGAAVALGDVLEKKEAEPFLTSLRKFGIGATYDCVDVADAQMVDKWVNKVAKDLGTPDLIIPNAAVVTTKTICEITTVQWNRELRINLDGAFYLAQSASKLLLEKSRPGRIVFVGSWAGHKPHIHIPAYSVAKAGLRMLCKCMALELAGAGILVNEVAPGYVDAGLTGKFFEKNPPQRKKAVERVPVNRLITPDEVAAQVVYLCDFENHHVTGTTLLMDGGLSLK